MRSIRDIRRDNLSILAKDHGGQAGLARVIGKDRNQVYQWLRPETDPKSRSLSDATAREIEATLALAQNWLDQDHTTPTTTALVERAEPLTNEDALRQVGQMLARMDEGTRKAALGLISTYSEDPDGRQALLRALMALESPDARPKAR